MYIQSTVQIDETIKKNRATKVFFNSGEVAFLNIQKNMR